MNTVKNEVLTLLESLPDQCTLEDVQYHLYVVEKIKRGINRSNKQEILTQDEVERNFNQWTIE